MIAPTSTYGCGVDSCVACYGDEEWRRENLPAYWLEALFEFEMCEECGEDAPGHEVTIDPFGNFHATCRPVGIVWDDDPAYAVHFAEAVSSTPIIEPEPVDGEFE